MASNKKYVELLWAEKYDDYEKGEKIPIEKPNLPFQVVETVNKPRVKGGYIDPSLLFPENEYPQNYQKDWKNLLIWGDNKLVMSSLVKQGWAGEINLIYIDPPFFTGSDFTIRTRLNDERIEKEPSIIEERAYKDTWSGGIASYLRYMYERLVLMRELLAENGSIYVHLDWHVGHYVKVMMDEIFGAENFRNKVIWHYYNKYSAGINIFPRAHDIILFHSKTDKCIFNEIREKREKPVKQLVRVNVNGVLKNLKDEQGNLVYREVWDKKVDDVWRIPQLQPASEEWMDFRTQKHHVLLKRIILASSNPGDIVADFFCGSGTTLAVAEKLGRRWLGCDLSKFAIQVTRKRLLDIHNSKDLMEDET